MMTKKIKIPKYFKDPRHSISIVLIGAGGTGSEMLNKLARIAYTMNTVDSRDLMVYLVDPDKVDAPNLGRQLFCTADIGRFKSDVLIERINRFYGTNWESIPNAFHPSYIKHTNIVITCTDNVESRMLVKKALSYRKTQDEYQTYFWLDMGNDFNSGNIILSSKLGELKLPDPFDIFGKVKNNPSRPSCSLAEAITKQHLMVNPFIADLAATLLWDLFTNTELDYQGMFFSLDSMKVVKIPIGHFKIRKNEKSKERLSLQES